MHRKVAGAVVVALALGVASCGGGDEPLTKAELVKQVNVVCKGKPQKARSGKRGPNSFFEQILAQQKEIDEGLDALTPPAELEDEFAALKEAQEGRRALLEKAIAALKENPKAQLDSLSEDGEDVQRQVASAATALGAKSCT